MSKTILGIFSVDEDAENAIERLKAEGYKPKDISIIMKDKTRREDLADSTGVDVVEGAAAGATSGAILGGIVGVLSSVAIPGLGAFLIGGPLAAALGLTGTAASTLSGAATGALAGGILGALAEFGLSQEEAKAYEESINDGGILVAVPAKVGEETEVAQIMTDTDAHDIKTIDNPKGFSLSHTEKEEDSYLDEESYDFTPGYAYAGVKGGKTKGRVVKSKKRGKRG